MAADHPIPQNLQDGFCEVVMMYPDWEPSRSGREVKIDGKYYSMTAVCGLVSSFDDPLPDNILALLFDHLRDRIALLEDLGKNRSYAAGGRCLLKLMEARRALLQTKS